MCNISMYLPNPVLLLGVFIQTAHCQPCSNMLYHLLKIIITLLFAISVNSLVNTQYST